MRRLPAALVAGAAGTLAIDAVTYADMALRGRPASPIPGRAVDALAARYGLRLGRRATAKHRREALAALLGHATGIGAALTLPLAEPLVRRLPPAAASVALGLGSMAASDLSTIRMGLTDPRTWGVAGWAEDVVPHVVFGTVTVAVYRALRSREAGVAQAAAAEQATAAERAGGPVLGETPGAP
jgi:hypothetical protein